MMSGTPVGQSVAILIWMTLPVAAGYVLWHAALKRRPEGDREASSIARLLSHLAILGAAGPLSFLLFWIATIPAGRAFALPLVGLFVHAFGGAAAWGLARGAGADLRTQGAHWLSGASSNVLTFGGIVTILLLRSEADPHAERALAEMALYRIFEAPFYFLCAWPLAARLSATGEKPSFRQSFRPVTVVPLAGILAGWMLNLGGVPRPHAFDGVAELLVKVNVILMGLTVGLTLRRAAPLKHLGACLRMSSVKFVLVPGVSVLLAWLLRFHGPTLQIVAICASMPVAFMAVVASNLLRLDEELVGSLWLFTTTGMLAVVPALAWALPAIGAG
jgi:predicted permease